MVDDVKKPVPDMNEIASVSRDPWNPAARLKFLLPLDDTLMTRGGTKSFKIYDEIERDARAFAVLQKRKMALLAFPWTVTPASDAPADKAAADLVTAQFENSNFNQAILCLQDALLKGFAVGECMWKVVDGVVTLDRVLARDQRRFTFDHDAKLRMRDWTNMWDGLEVPERKFVVHSVGSKDNSPFGLGLGTRLFWLVYFKRQDITFWLSFLDKFGSPTAVGKYPAGTPKQSQNQLMDALMSIAQDAGVIIPENMQIELLEAARSGSIDAYERAARYFDEEITIAVLGETLSTSLGDAGSKAASETHNDVRLELVQSDGELIAETLNKTVITWLTKFNVSGANPPKIAFDVQEGENLAARAERDKLICDMGFKPTLKYITETYGGEWEEAAPAPMPSMLPTDGPAFADPSPQAQATEVDEFSDQVGNAIDPVISGAVAQIRALLERSTSLQDFRDGLAGLASSMDAQAFGKAMEQAGMASSLAGRYSIAQAAQK